MKIIKRNKNELDHFHDLGDLLAAVYQGSDYRFGELHFAEPMGPDECPEHLIDPPDFMKGGWTKYHEIPTVLHPEKGVLFFRKAYLRDDDHPRALGLSIQEVHKDLIQLEWKLRHRLEELDFWKNRPIIMGVGVVTQYRCHRRLRPKSVDPAAIIDRDALPQFASHVDALFDHYTTPQAEPVSDWGQRLVRTVTTSQGHLGSFVGEESLIGTYDEWDRPLDGLVETAV